MTTKFSILRDPEVPTVRNRSFPRQSYARDRSVYAYDYRRNYSPRGKYKLLTSWPLSCTKSLYFKEFFETQSYPCPWYGIGHLNIVRGAESLGIRTCVHGKLCYSQGGLIIEEQLALLQQSFNFLETLRWPRCDDMISVTRKATRSADLGIHMYQGR